MLNNNNVVLFFGTQLKRLYIISKELIIHATLTTRIHKTFQTLEYHTFYIRNPPTVPIGN